jgi:hypothetical protein
MRTIGDRTSIEILCIVAKFIRAALLTAASVLGAFYLLSTKGTESNRPLATGTAIARTYARDFGQAYDYLSSGGLAGARAPELCEWPGGLQRLHTEVHGDSQAS